MKRSKVILGLIVYLAIIYFPLFLHLDSLSLRKWDESRRGVNAMEMVEGGHLLVPQFEGNPDMYGTKPPLLIWSQAIGMKIFGVTELAVRLPSAIAGLFTVLLLVLFSWRYLDNAFAGFIGGIILVTTPAYINAHGAISGDYDALLTLWLTGYIFAFYAFLKNRQFKYLYLVGLFVVLAGWTKGVAGMFFLPPLLIFCVLDKTSQEVLGYRQLYGTTIVAIGCVAAYYFARESINPGFLDAIWNNEIYGRFITASDGNSSDFWYYFRRIYTFQRFHPWLFFFPVSILILWLHRPSRHFASYALLVICVFFVVISTSKTKLTWYFLPSLPVACLLIGWSFVIFYEWVSGKVKLRKVVLKQCVGVTCLAIIFFIPYHKIIKKVHVSHHSGWEWEMVTYADYMEQLKEYRKYIILHPSYNGHIAFYKQQYNKYKGGEIEESLIQPIREQVQAPQRLPDSFMQGELIMVCEASARTYLETQYSLQQVHSGKHCALYRILGKE
jgi:4-amino-4-deoxy-L-arabinose transferase-like glycosyltransferase